MSEVDGRTTAARARWAGDRTLGDWLVSVLHVGYAFVPAGFVLAALGAIGFVAQSAGLHAWMVGAAGMMTLAVMTRATHGHTGHELVAAAPTQIIFVMVFSAAVARIWAAIEPAWTGPLLYIAAVAWTVAFFGFSIFYGRMLWRPRSF